MIIIAIIIVTTIIVVIIIIENKNKNHELDLKDIIQNYENLNKMTKKNNKKSREKRPN
jgi:hypothetical protein